MESADPQASALPERVAHWCARLLDLSRRNRLLNFKEGPWAIRLPEESPSEMEDEASSASSFERELTDPEEGPRRVLGLYRATKNDIEEGGANTLYLAFGTLMWRDGQGAKSALRRAPIMLCPVRLSRTKKKGAFKLTRTDEDTVVNVTLLEMLRREHSMRVPEAETPPSDEHGFDVSAILRAFDSAVSSMPGWEVRPEVWLGRFSFGKFLLWKDLSTRTDALAESPVVAHLLKGEGSFKDGAADVAPADVDAACAAKWPICPLPADSSQLAAVLSAVGGRNFVLHGPPGTGKSQTITNLICACLAEGKTVLFVAEKRAALEVVQRRLNKIGLAPFCLELHSNKAGKADVVRQFGEALSTAASNTPAEWQRTLDARRAARESLSSYVAALHAMQPCGLTAYDAFSHLLENAPAGTPALPDCDIGDGGWAKARAAVDALVGAFPPFDRAAFAPLSLVHATEWSPAWVDALSSAAEKFTGLASDFPSDASPDSFCRVISFKALFHPGRTSKLRAARRELLAALSLPELPRDATFGSLAGSLSGVLGNRGLLREWCRWRAAVSTAEKSGLAPLVAALESGALQPSDAATALNRGYSERLLRAILDKEARLRDFFGGAQDELVRRFCELDDKIAKLSVNVARARLGVRAAETCTKFDGSYEMKFLRHEVGKKMRHKPVRTLIESTPNLRPVLKPCLLMSPLSVAQYLPPESPLFDIVVFDEASQLTVWDAVGALARGRQAVIVGDPMQLPPTNFFQRADDSGDGDSPEEQEDETIRDLDSILDECRAAGVPSKSLLWHYRSRHESLIAFSNEHYYEGGLYTFPSAAAACNGLGVKYVKVEGGVYDRSRTRTNRKEAEAVAGAVVARLLDPAMADKTCGVVTFSMAQQSLIEDLLEDAQAEHPEIMRFFADDNPEPVFVKNLENVQGDERDAIFFSIGYAPDENGTFAMNFGPLNRPGGERRLNVAVTRAREEVVVFSSVESSRIDLSRTQALGAAHLRDFLAYAENGGGAELPAGASGARGDDFAATVADVLRKAGYEVDRGVGRSSYKLDLAVRSPDGDGYRVGVECDGAMYRDAATVRDREESRRLALEGLGWKIVRCWSAEWYFDRARAERKLLDAVAEACGKENK